MGLGLGVAWVAIVCVCLDRGRGLCGRGVSREESNAPNGERVGQGFVCVWGKGCVSWSIDRWRGLTHTLSHAIHHTRSRRHVHSQPRKQEIGTSRERASRVAWGVEGRGREGSKGKRV